MTVFWWDTEAVGRDETDAEELVYQYADAGLRYLWGEFPTEPIDLFNAATAVDQYDEPPPSEIPEYEPLQPSE